MTEQTPAGPAPADDFWQNAGIPRGWQSSTSEEAKALADWALKNPCAASEIWHIVSTNPAGGAMVYIPRFRPEPGLSAEACDQVRHEVLGVPDAQDRSSDADDRLSAVILATTRDMMRSLQPRCCCCRRRSS